jgi:putative membrane protein insertion efficiency factor
MLKKIILFLIQVYQKNISPTLPPRCRFYPSCSEYSKECFDKYPVYISILKTIWRILRCNPFSQGGYDPS